MRIIWNEQEHWFQAELGLNEFWREDMELVRSLGFKTTGSPLWLWHTSKASILNKLRDTPPKSGLTITELALEKYKSINEQEQQKADLKKQLEKAKKLAALEISANNWKDYIDPETGIVCKEVLPAESKFVWKYAPPPKPDAWCFICGDAVYDYEGTDVCLWCSK